MFKKLQTTLFTFLLVIVSAATAYAGNFSGNDVSNVINAMTSIDDTKVPNSMNTLEKFADGDFEAAMDNAGNLVLFQKMLDTARAAPSEYSHFQYVATSNGFSSPEQWALKSDRVLMAFMLTEIPKSDLEIVVGLTPDQINEIFPAGEQADILSIRKMGKQLLAVPQGDIDAFAPYTARYKKALN